MNIEDLLANKAIKPKEKTETLSTWLLDGHLDTNDLIEFASKGKDTLKATCIEAVEFATNRNLLWPMKKCCYL